MDFERLISSLKGFSPQIIAAILVFYLILKVLGEEPAFPLWLKVVCYFIGIAVIVFLSVFSRKKPDEEKE